MSLSLEQTEERFKHMKTDDDGLRGMYYQDSYITTYCNREKDPWHVTISSYESIVLKNILHGIAMGIHSLTPSVVKGDYPVNFRFLAKPMNLVLFVLIIWMIHYIFF